VPGDGFVKDNESQTLVKTTEIEYCSVILTMGERAELYSKVQFAEVPRYVFKGK
jgi:hypothetical protein